MMRTCVLLIQAQQSDPKVHLAGPTSIRSKKVGKILFLQIIFKQNKFINLLEKGYLNNLLVFHIYHLSSTWGDSSLQSNLMVKFQVKHKHFDCNLNE